MSTLSPSPLPTLLRLPTETLDRILSFSLPPGAKAQRLALNKLLSVHPLLSALVRRRLYRKLSCLVGDPKKRDERVLNLLDGGGGGEDEKREGYGHLVRFLKIRRPRADPPSAAPLAPPPEFDFVGDPLDPAATLLPRPRVSQAETMRVFVRLAEAVKGVKHVEWDLRGGTVFEGQEEDAEGEMVSFGGRDQLDRLEGALKKWRAVDTFLYAVEDASQRQQVLSTPTWSSPLLNAMMEWETLTYLDLWRVKVVLPPSTPQPKFRLKELRLTQSTLGGEKELEFFLGAPSSTSEGQRRAANLEFLFLTDVDFLSYPSAATKPDDAPSPLLTLFRCDSPFVSQLRNLDLTTRLPLGPPGSTDGLLSGLTALETVELGGPGIDEGVFASLFLSAATGAAPPAKTLKHLTLTYLTHPTLPLPTILSYLSPLPFPTSTHSHTVRPQPPLSLLSLRFNTGFPLPRPLALSLPYRERRLIHDPVWEPLSAFGPTRDVDGEEEAWDAIERACRGLNREKRRVAIADSGEGKWDPVKLHKNHSEVQYDALNSPASSSDDEEDSDADSDDSDARSREMNALFVPDEEDIEEIEREEGREWQESVREAVRREQEEEEEDGFN